MNARLVPVFLLAGLMALVPESAGAQEFSIDFGQDGSFTGRIIQMILVLTVLSLAPSILIVLTSFTRIVVVLSLLRNAMGTQQTPPNMVLISLALFLTGFIMMPTFQAAYENGIRPMIDQEIEQDVAFTETIRPFKVFMLAHVREKDLTLFLDFAGQETVENAEDVPIAALIPAFIISELKRAFEIGFLLYVPFVIIDLVIASILMSMGMMMLPPVMLSLPFKLIFFVLVDGWHLVVGSLVQSYGGMGP